MLNGEARSYSDFRNYFFKFRQSEREQYLDRSGYFSRCSNHANKSVELSIPLRPSYVNLEAAIRWLCVDIVANSEHADNDKEWLMIA
eukprot:8243995-Pyramimonas_sp.AAC.1